MEVYHGSPIGGLTQIEPRVSTHGKSYVYATKKREIAVLFLAKWNDFIFNLSTINDNGREIVYLTERYADALIEIYSNKSGYLYVLDGSAFGEGQTSFNEEVVSTEAASVIRCEKIDNILWEISKYEIDGVIRLFRFPDRPNFILNDNSDLIRKALYFYKTSGNRNVIDYCITKHPYLKDELMRQFNESMKENK